MKTNTNKVNKENFRSRRELELSLRKDELEKMISWLPDYDKSDDMRDLLISQIHNTKMRIKTIETEMKIIDFVKGFRKQPKKAN